MPYQVAAAELTASNSDAAVMPEADAETVVDAEPVADTEQEQDTLPQNNEDID